MLPRLRAVLACAVAVVAGGCFEVEAPILTKGDWAPIAGAFACKTLLNQTKIILTEQKAGLISADYRYTDTDGYRITARQLSPDFYLVQSEYPGKRVIVGYLDTADKDHIKGYGADIYSAPNPIPGMARLHNVMARESQTQMGAVTITGKATDVTAFFTGHTMQNLALVMECARVAQAPPPVVHSKPSTTSPKNLPFSDTDTKIMRKLPN